MTRNEALVQIAVAQATINATIVQNIDGDISGTDVRMALLAVLETVTNVTNAVTHWNDAP